MIWRGAVGVLSVLAVLAVSPWARAPIAAAQIGTVFEDVADGAYYVEPVAALAEDGFFAGTLCEEGFCPGEPIDRKTMAVWVVRVLDGADPPAVSQTSFDDVDADGFHAAFIERMHRLEVTRGCGDGSGFCPHDNVTRAQMAAFLSRAFKLPDGPDPGFADVPATAWYAADVAKLAASGMTGGCGDGTGFCPSQETTRAKKPPEPRWRHSCGAARPPTNNKHRAATPPSLPVPSTHARSEPTRPSHAGVLMTFLAFCRMSPQASSPPSRRATVTHARSGPTGPPCAGAPTG